MERKEAVEILKSIGDGSNDYNPTEEERRFTEAYNMAVRTLEQQPCEDCVSREEVKKIVDFYKTMYDGICRVNEDIDKLPSVKPAIVWHRVKDELPEENGLYLACHEDATVLLDWFNGKWFFHGKNPAVEETGTIIAWMPLPEWEE